MYLTTQLFNHNLIRFGLALLLVGLNLVWLEPPLARAAEPPACYPNTSLPNLRLENSPLGDHVYGDHPLDFDGDGKTDVFSIVPGAAKLQWNWRFSPGGSQPWQDLKSSTIDPAELRFGNFDGDDEGITDIFSLHPVTRRWRYSPGGSGPWKYLNGPVGRSLERLRFGDFNGDGITDVFSQDEDGQWKYSPGGNAPWENLASSVHSLEQLRFGDFDGDGITDVFSRGQGGRWQYSKGGREDWQDLERSNRPLEQLRFGDFDGDGITDVFSRGQGGQWQYSKGGRGTWIELNKSPGTVLADLRFGDFDGDGITDVFNQKPGGKWRVSFGGTTPWRVLYTSLDHNGGRLTCLIGTSNTSRNSYSPAISADGRKIVFLSDTDFKGEDIPDGQFEVWLYDVASGQLRRITTASGPDRRSYSPAISADGSKIVFASDSDFFREGNISHEQYEIWLYDVDSDRLSRVTTASAPDRYSDDPTISANSSKIVFASDSGFKGEDIPDGQFEVWLYDVASGQLRRITTASDSDRDSYSPAISADGSKIVFTSDSDFKSEGISRYQDEIWLYDAPSNQLSRVTTASAPDRHSYSPTISADGSKIVFASYADFLGQDIPNDQSEIWLYDVPGDQLHRITTASEPHIDNSFPAISADGRNIVFESDADFLDQGIPNDQSEIWLYDVPSGQLRRITTASEPGRDSSIPAISADGNKIVFYSNSDFLGLDIPQDKYEIWLFEDHPPTPDPDPNPNPDPDPDPNPGEGVTVYLPLVVK